MDKTLYIITLEPIEKRYTKQWHKYLKEGFSKHFDKVVNVDGTIGDDVIKKGRFLDINKTNVWKAEQVQKIAELFGNNKIKDNDVFIFMDAWNFAVTATKYMAQLNNIQIKMYGYWHAGSYDPNDFVTQAGLQPWAKYVEIGWAKALDGCFVATKFHKTLMMRAFSNKIKSTKIHVVGFPMDWFKEIFSLVGPKLVTKRNLIVFPHRTDPEKQPEVFKTLAKQLPQYEFVITTDVTTTKKEYYKLLQQAKIVFSANLQETYGIGTVEGLILGAIPVVPNRLVYPEMYDGKFVYSNKAGAKQKIKYIMENWETDIALKKSRNKNREEVISSSLNALGKMAEVMLK